MIKNINDLLSVVVLALIVIYSIRILIWSYIKKDTSDATNENASKLQLILDYIDNEEE